MEINLPLCSVISINGKKKGFHVQHCPCGTVGAKKGYVLGLLVHSKVVVESMLTLEIKFVPVIKFQ